MPDYQKKNMEVLRIQEPYHRKAQEEIAISLNAVMMSYERPI